jgi:hypothetical protein
MEDRLSEGRVFVEIDEEGHTTHIDRINLVSLGIHLINNMSSLECDCLVQISICSQQTRFKGEKKEK